MEADWVTEHERQVLRFIYGRGLAFSVQPERVSESIRGLLENGLIERGRDLDEDAGSTVYRITSWGRVVLGVGELAVQ
ncbi:hypothetical protein K3718_21420 (plasmid) [Leisingera aquaemixtae]|uniref:Uncharacterized protein n=1 Tax=Leisingera aquaemixtae TaxID=1396826 RepID=A0ABY5WRB8_9RHOB|nr:hypothetical protein [Leisingera aquaemixtae]UWQ44055.1 hypothetical protein K3718_21420 [Leisingera aquaemixtae]